MTRKVLHPGCGSKGRIPLDVFPHAEWTETRLDIDPATNPDIVASMVAIGGPNDEYDAIYTCHALEHLPPQEVSVALSEFHRVLKPGGMLLLAVPDTKAVVEALAADPTKDLYSTLYESTAGPVTAADILWGYHPALFNGQKWYAHQTGFTPRTLKGNLEAAKFQDVFITRDNTSFGLFARAMKAGAPDMPRWSIGICTPIPAVPINQEGIDREKVAEALHHLSGENKNLYEAQRLLAEVTTEPTEPGPTHLGLITPEWQRARAVLQIPMGHCAVDIYADGKEVGVARNDAVKTAQAAKVKWLFFLDWDTIPPQDALMRLVWQLENNPEYDVASGVYTSKTQPAQPLLWHDWHDGVYYDWTAGDVLKDQIVGVPMGCCLIRMSVFDRMPASDKDPWFKTVDQPVLFEGIWQHAKMTEDLYLCKRLQEIGAKIMVDGGILCHHIDHNTGHRYKLADDSLPMKRAIERAEKAKAEKSAAMVAAAPVAATAT